MVRSITSDSVVDAGRINAMCRGDEGGGELLGREASTDDLGVSWDDIDKVVVKGDGVGEVRCIGREEEFTGWEQGTTCQDGRVMVMKHVVRGC